MHVMRQSKFYFSYRNDGKNAGISFHLPVANVIQSDPWILTITACASIAHRRTDGYRRLCLHGYSVSGATYGKSDCLVRVLDGQIEIFNTKVELSKPKYDEFRFPVTIAPDVIEITISVAFGACYDMKPKSWSNLKSIFDQGLLTDLIVRTEGKDFPCHKLVLAAESEYFMTMFRTNMTESQDNVVDWRGVFDSTTVEILLHFLYTGKIPAREMKMPECLSLLEAAHLTLLEELKNVCAFILGQIVSIDDVVEVLARAELFDLGELKDSALNFVITNYDEVVKTDAWKEDPERNRRWFAGSIYEVLIALNGLSQSVKNSCLTAEGVERRLLPMDPIEYVRGVDNIASTSVTQSSSRPNF